MQQLFKVVERLHHLELYDDLCLFCELHLPGEPTKTFIDCEDELDLDQCGYLLCCMANACAQLNNFPQAIRNYEMAHLYLSNIRQRKLKNRYEHELNGAEIRFRMHKVFLESKQEEEALRCLESVPRTELTPKILLSMARLCHQLGKMPSQSTRSLFNRRVDAPNTRILNYFKAIIKDVPEAVYCRSYLLSVGAIKSPVLSPSAEHSNNKTTQQNAAATGTTTEDALLPAELANGLSCAETRVWAEAKQQQAKKCFLEAAKLLETASVAPNLRFLLEQARFYRIAGDHHKALACYQQAHLFDSTNAEGMDALAALLGTSNSQQSQRELDLLAHKMLHSNPNRPEAFVVYGWAVRQCHRVTEAKQLAQKAEQLAQRRGRQRCEALLLKAQLLFDTKRHYKEMEMALADALHNDCTNTAVYALYIQMFIAQKRCAEAQRMAKTSMKFVGEHNHQIRFLFAQALAEDPNAGGQSGTDQAIAVLEKMVKDGQLISLEPLLLLARLYDRQQKYEKAIELLSRFKESFADPRIHRELGDLLSKTNRPNEALGEYGQAMSASATDSSTKERMINLMGGFTTPQCAVNAVFESGPGAGGGTTTTATTTNMGNGNAAGGGSTGPNEARGIRMPPPVARVTRRMAVNQHEQLRRLRGMGGINRPSSAISSGGGTASAGSSSGGRGGSRAAQIHRIANAPAGNRMAVASGLSPVLAPLRFDDDQQQQQADNSRMDADDSEDSNNSQLSLDGPREEEEDEDDDEEEEGAEEDANTTNGSSSTAEQPRAGGGGSGGHAAMVHRMVSDIQRYMVRNVSTTTTAPAASASSNSATTTTTAAASSASATTYEPTSASNNSTMAATTTTTTGTTTIQQQGSSIDSSGGADADFVPLIADEPLVEGGGTGEGSMVDEGEEDEEEEDGRMSIDNGGGDIGREEVLALSEDEDDDQMNLT